MEKKISDLLASRRTFSIELFPPKTEAGATTLKQRVLTYQRFRPDFLSVTHGAGGTFEGDLASATRELALYVQEKIGVPAMAHLTCRNFTRDQVRRVLAEFQRSGIHNLMALRGDPPKGSQSAPVGELKNATDLIRLAAQDFKFSVGCAGYPEGHLEATSPDKDWDYLRLKLELGAQFIVTQFFLDNTHFFRFRDQLVKRRIRAPLLAGILPISNYSQVTKFALMCGCTIPARVMKGLYGRSDADQERFGLDHAAEQIGELIREGVDGIHLYALNKDATVERLGPIVRAGLG